MKKTGTKTSTKTTGSKDARFGDLNVLDVLACVMSFPFRVNIEWNEGIVGRFMDIECRTALVDGDGKDSGHPREATKQDIALANQIAEELRQSAFAGYAVHPDSLRLNVKHLGGEDGLRSVPAVHSCEIQWTDGTDRKVHFECAADVRGPSEPLGLAADAFLSSVRVILGEKDERVRSLARALNPIRKSGR
jgi:hypothetical protein